jgi:hypothetical protein
MHPTLIELQNFFIFPSFAGRPCTLGIKRQQFNWSGYIRNNKPYLHQCVRYQQYIWTIILEIIKLAYIYTNYQPYIRSNIHTSATRTQEAISILPVVRSFA